MASLCGRRKMTPKAYDHSGKAAHMVEQEEVRVRGARRRFAAYDALVFAEARERSPRPRCCDEWLGYLRKIGTAKRDVEGQHGKVSRR